MAWMEVRAYRVPEVMIARCVLPGYLVVGVIAEMMEDQVFSSTFLLLKLKIKQFILRFERKTWN